jgi:hypothetical protein
VRGDGPAEFGAAGLSAFGAPHEWPDVLRDLEGRTGSSSVREHARPAIWILKRLMQKLGVRLWRTRHLPFHDSVPSAAIGASLCSSRASRIGRHLAVTVVGDLPSIARRRQRHQLIWDALLQPDLSEGRNLVAAERPLRGNWTPYLAAYYAPSGSASRFYDEWQRRGLCVTTWPDLPPEVASDLQYHANAWQLRDSRVYLPVHQSLTAGSMTRKCRPSVDIDRSSRLSLVWNDSTPDQWADWVSQCKRSNMLQAWAYGDAKCTAEGWRVKRAVFYRGDEPVALVQVLEKRVAKLLKVRRINRGPLVLRTLSAVEERTLWTQLGKLGSLWRGTVLVVAPELLLSGYALILLDELGFRQFSPIATESVWVDLARELEDLRKSINGKWRNMLVSAEKAGLALEVGSGDELLDWIIARYESLMEAKSFSGIGIGLLRALHKQAGPKEKLIVLRALHAGEAVAGICVARHGCAATYLLGWNGDAGRRLKANQFLLWQAIRHLKEAGSQWFDLGGISEEKTPGITAFKLGLNGERYELVGEYWKW